MEQNRTDDNLCYAEPSVRMIYLEKPDGSVLILQKAVASPLVSFCTALYITHLYNSAFRDGGIFPSRRRHGALDLSTYLHSAAGMRLAPTFSFLTPALVAHKA
jgi:hypothetical protein